MIGEHLGKASATVWVGLVVGLLGLFVHISLQATESFNGRVTSCSYTDLAPWIGAVVCFVCAGKCWFGRTITGRDARVEAGAAGVIAVLVLLNVGRGILYATHAIGPCS